MIENKSLIGLVAVFLTFIGYFPYILDILNKKTKPHVFSWIIWTIVTGIIYLLQVSDGAGAGSWVTLCLTLILLLIVFLSIKNGHKDIKKLDLVFLILALLALPIWLIIKQPILSIILLTTIDMLGFLPTIRKSWNSPYSETLSFYIITTFRHGISILALEKYTIVTWLFPVSWVLGNALFSLFLMIRRKSRKKL